MFKKLLIATSVLALSTGVTFAANYKGDYKGEACPACPSIMAFAAAPYVGGALGVITNTGQNTSFRGIPVQLFAGYGAMMTPNFYLAGELFGTPGTFRVSDRDNGANTSVKTTWDFGASIIPGFMFNETTLGYLRGGVTRTRFSRISTNKTGWHIGLGAETTLWGMQNWDVRGEYVYTRYRNVTANVGNVDSDRVNFGIVYKFL